MYCNRDFQIKIFDTSETESHYYELRVRYKYVHKSIAINT